MYLNFFDTFCDFTKFEELELDTNSLFIALSDHELYDCIPPAMEKKWNTLERETVKMNFKPTQQIFFRRICCDKQKKHETRAWAIQRRIPQHRKYLSV